jgi:hypothetical protein
MKSLFIIFYLMTGRMEQHGPLYNIHIDVNNQYDWVYDACEGEVYQWLETGVFTYDDNLCECGELEFFNATDEQGE